MYFHSSPARLSGAEFTYSTTNTNDGTLAIIKTLLALRIGVYGTVACKVWYTLTLGCMMC